MLWWISENVLCMLKSFIVEFQSARIALFCVNWESYVPKHLGQGGIIRCYLNLITFFLDSKDNNIYVCSSFSVSNLDCLVSLS